MRLSARENRAPSNADRTPRLPGSHNRNQASTHSNFLKKADAQADKHADASKQTSRQADKQVNKQAFPA
jgi:hypothetical protein